MFWRLLLLGANTTGRGGGVLLALLFWWVLDKTRHLGINLTNNMIRMGNNTMIVVITGTNLEQKMCCIAII